MCGAFLRTLFLASALPSIISSISDFIEIPTVKSRFFSDCPSFVKSLGAWGGDFVMSSKFVGFKDYFWGKGFTTIFEWDDIIYC